MKVLNLARANGRAGLRRKVSRRPLVEILEARTLLSFAAYSEIQANRYSESKEYAYATQDDANTSPVRLENSLDLYQFGDVSGVVASRISSEITDVDSVKVSGTLEAYTEISYTAYGGGDYIGGNARSTWKFTSDNAGILRVAYSTTAFDSNGFTPESSMSISYVRAGDNSLSATAIPGDSSGELTLAVDAARGGGITFESQLGFASKLNSVGSKSVDSRGIEGRFEWSFEIQPDISIEHLLQTPSALVYVTNVRGSVAVPDGVSTSTALYWASGTSHEDVIGEPIRSFPIETSDGLTTASVAWDDLKNPPAGATHLVAVADPDDVIDEIYDGNNVKSYRLPDIASSAPVIEPIDGSVSFTYTISGNQIPNSTTVDLYWADDDLNPLGTIVSETTPIYAGFYTVKVPSLGSAPAGATHLLVVADPANIVVESDETNNIQAIEFEAAPDIAPSIPTMKSDGSVSFSYTISGNDLPKATTVVVYWADENLNPLGMITSVTTPTARGTYPVSVPSLGSPSAGATHILVRADPANAIEELDEDNNDVSLKVIFAPDVAVHVDPSSPKKGESYTISIDVTNNSLIHQTFTVDLGEIPMGEAANLFDGGAIDSQSVGIDPGRTTTLNVGVQAKNWDWIPRSNPVMSNGNGRLISDLWDAFKDLAWSDVVSKGPSILAKANSVLNVAKAAFEAADELYKPTRQLEFGYVAEASAGSSSTKQDSTSTEVYVPLKYQFAHDAFVSSLTTAKYVLGAGITLIPFLPESALFYFAAMATAASDYANAAEFYNQAVDPPDPDYTNIVVPGAPSLPEVDASPSGPPKLLAQLTLELAGVRQAEAISRDRSLGARDAGALDWQSKQLVAASGFAAEAMALEVRINALRTLVESSSDYSRSYTGADIAAYLRANGLPEPLVETLEELGWTTEEIAALGSNLANMDAEAFAQSEQDDFSQLAVIRSGATAFEELGEAIQLRVERPGAEVRDLSPDERSGLNDLRASVATGLEEGYPSGALLQTINSYVADARRLALETNNFDAVSNDLDFGYGALVNFQQLDATPAGIRSYVEQLKTDGQIDGPTADSLLAPLIPTDQHLTDGEYTAAQANLAGFVDAVRADSGTGIPTEVASDLVDYARYVDGSLDTLPALAVEQMMVNGGDAQRSNVETVSIRFNQGTNLQSLIDDGSITSLVQLAALTDGVSTVDLTSDHFRWDAAANLLLVDLTIDGFGGSRRTLLADGEYELRLANLDSIRNPDAIDKLLADADGTDDGRMAFAFHRLFGDTDGDGDVDNLDLFLLRSSVGKQAGDEGFLAFLDYNDDGIIDAFDLAEVAKRRRTRFGG